MLADDIARAGVSARGASYGNTSFEHSNRAGCRILGARHATRVGPSEYWLRTTVVDEPGCGEWAALELKEHAYAAWMLHKLADAGEHIREAEIVGMPAKLEVNANVLFRVSR